MLQRLCHLMDLFEISRTSYSKTLFGFKSYFLHQLSQLLLARLLINVYETIVIHSATSFPLQRYNKNLKYASILCFFDIFAYILV